MGTSGAIGGSRKPLRKWKLFKATDYVSLLWPCFEISKIHGFFPYKITSGPTITSSKPGYIYATVMMITTILWTGNVLYQIDISGTLEYDSVPGSLQGNCYLVLGWAIGFISYITSSKRMRLLSDLAEVSNKLPTSSFTSMTKIVHGKDIFGFLFLVGQAPNIYSTDIPLVFGKLLDLYITLVVYLMDSLYVDCVCIIRACFERINNNLLALKESIEKEEPHLLRRVYHEQKNPLLLLEIRSMKKQHNEISEVVQRLNSTFGLQIIATVTLTFAEITFSLYFYILQLLGSKGINLEKQIWYSFFITSVTYYAFKLASIVWACETAKKQALRTGIVVHEVLIDTTDKQVKEEVREMELKLRKGYTEIKTVSSTSYQPLPHANNISELQLFSLQLLHRDNTFTAKGLSLDATLVTAIVGGITTYLLILIQFLISSKSCGSVLNSPPMAITAGP